MLDVQAPHELIHGRRNVFLHIATITIALLIALALAAGVEWLHSRHLATRAQENIRHEIQENQRKVAGNRDNIEADRKRMQADMTALRALRRDPNAKNIQITLAWNWSAFNSSAWMTARDTRALALLNYTTVQSYAEVYQEQQVVNDAAVVLINTQTRALVPMSIEDSFKDAAPSEIDEALHHCAEVVVQLQVLDNLLNGLDNSYKQALSKP